MIVRERLDRIRSGGHWLVTLRPATYSAKRIASPSACQAMAEACVVHLRGWDYPHLDREETRLGLDHVQSGCDWHGEIELWRLYESGQLVHHFAMGEDHGWTDPQDVQWLERFDLKKSERFLGVTNCLYTLTEIYEFTQRLAARGVLSEAFDITVTLGGTRERQLLPGHGRVILGSYLCYEAELPFSVRYSTEDFLARGHGLSLEHALWVLERFNWREPPAEVLREEQQRFLTRRRG